MNTLTRSVAVALIAFAAQTGATAQAAQAAQSPQAPTALGATVSGSYVTTRDGEVPVRLVGYGLVVGLDGTGDRSFGGSGGAVPAR